MNRCPYCGGQMEFHETCQVSKEPHYFCPAPYCGITVRMDKAPLINIGGVTIASTDVDITKGKKPSQAQLAARQKFAEMAKSRKKEVIDVRIRKG